MIPASFFSNSLMPVGAEYGIVSPACPGSTDTRSHRIHYVVTGHVLCQRSRSDTVGEIMAAIEPVSIDMLFQSVMDFDWEPFSYWILDD